MFQQIWSKIVQVQQTQNSYKYKAMSTTERGSSGFDARSAGSSPLLVRGYGFCGLRALKPDEARDFKKNQFFKILLFFNGNIIVFFQI